MGRYLLANRRTESPNARAAAVAAASAVFRELFGRSSTVVAEIATFGSRARHAVLFDAADDEVARKAPRLPPDVFVEPQILHELAVPIRYIVHGHGAPIMGAQLIARIRDRQGRIQRIADFTDAQGTVDWRADSEVWSVDSLVIIPGAGYWSCVLLSPDPEALINCAPLPAGPRAWWHELVGGDVDAARCGAGIKVGVVDTGAGPNACLSHVENLGAYLVGQHLAQGGDDVEGHGTHVAGLIGARPVAETDFVGIAPACALASVRAFPKGERADQVDVVGAIDLLTDSFEADFINLSLVAAKPSQFLADAILDCREAGILCVCAAGNASGAVGFPAAFADAIAVSALGLDGSVSPDSLSAGQRPQAPDQVGDEGLFLARFSCRGPEVFCAAPGVGIISTIPTRTVEPHFGVMDGTSMASPIVCGVAAALASTDEEYKRLPRGRARVARARDLVAASCRSVGLPRVYQGHGVPRVSMPGSSN